MPFADLLTYLLHFKASPWGGWEGILIFFLLKSVGKSRFFTIFVPDITNYIVFYEKEYYRMGVWGCLLAFWCR